MCMIAIETPEELEQLKTMPTGKFYLAKDLDLGGREWDPVNFSGLLDGKGKKICNFSVVNATNTGCQGFFGSLEKTAQIRDLTLTDFRLLQHPNAKNVGTVAGENRGSIENCCVGEDAGYKPTPRGKRNALTGNCDGSYVQVPEGSDAWVGSVVGSNFGTVANAKSYVALHAPKQALCGHNSGKAEGLYRDVSQRTQLLPRSAVAMRQKIVEHMERQGDFRWIPSKNMGFTSAYSGSFKVYEQDTVHYGLPYTQKNGSMERAVYCLDADDYVAAWLPDFSDAAPEAQGCTETPWDVYLGNDCSGAVYWAWQRACPCATFGYTGDMIPTKENQALYGVLPVGAYAIEEVVTTTTVEGMDPSFLWECFALLHMGDAIVSREPTYGHTRLVARDPMVMRRTDGTIDPDESYLATHEQGVGKGSSGRCSTWQLNGRYTFRQLMETWYLPITNRDLQEGKQIPVRIGVEGITGPFEGIVRANYRIISTRVELKSQDTGKVYTGVEFTALDKDRNKATPKADGYARSTVCTVALKDLRKSVGTLPTGEYTYRVSLELSTGEQYILREGSCRL